MAKAKVNIPWPHEHLNETPYIAYDWPAGDGKSSYAGWFWERRRRKLIDVLESSYISYTDNIPELKALGERVEQIGKAEQAKELAYLKSNLPDFDFTNIKQVELINKLNELMIGAEQYKYALDRINRAIKLGNEARKNGEKYKNLAPTMSALFLSYLTTAFTEEMRQIAKQDNFTVKKAVEQWKNNIDEILSRSIDTAMRKIMTESFAETDIDKIYGDAAQWRAIGELYEKLGEFQKRFKEMLRSQLNIEKLKTFFDTKERQTILLKTRRNKIKTGGFAEQLGWKSQVTGNQINGRVNEYIQELIVKNIPKKISIDTETKVAPTTMMKADIIEFYQYEAEIDTDFRGLFDELQESLIGSQTLKETAQQLQNFYDKNLANLSKNNFFTMTNVKMASMGAGFSGFHNGEKQPIERLGDYIDMAGISQEKAKEFIQVVYNTIDTGIYSDKREEVEDTIRNILTSAAARLLFDDWSTIGVENTGTQILNFFNLDGIIVPSSFLFLNLGEAIKKAAEDLGRNKMGSWFSVYVHMPTTAIYKNTPDRYSGPEFGNTNESIKRGIWDKWNEQVQVAKKEAYFETKFLLNFKSQLARPLYNSYMS